MFIGAILGLFTLAFTLLLPTVQPPPLAASPALYAGSVRFKHIDIEQGLPSSRVLSILQDRQGFMWFGTAEGLSRYDGHEFKNYQVDFDDPRTISNNVVWAFYEDRAGYLWAGTDGGLNRYDPGTETFTRYQHDPADDTSLSNNSVLSIYEDKEGVLWVGTLGGGLNRFDRESETFTRHQHDPDDAQSLGSNEIRGIVEDANGNLWVGAYGGGLNQLAPAKSAGDPPIFRRFQNDPSDPQSLSSDLIEALYTDPMGILWVATWDGGLNRFDPVTERFTHYRSDPDDAASLSSDIVASLAGGPGGELWAGTWDGGLNRFDPTDQTWISYRHNPAEPFSLSHDSIRSLYVSRDGLIYAGTAGGGLNVLDPTPNPFQTLRNEQGNLNSLSQNDVRAVVQDRAGVLWIGTNSAGLNRYDPMTGLFTRYLHDPNDPASLANNTVRALAEDRDGNLWLGTFGGLDKLDRKTGRFVHYQSDPKNPRSLSANRVYVIYEDRSGALWIGTDGGLNGFDRQTQTFTRYQSDPTDATSLSNNIVISLYEDGTGALWVGTRGGLNRLDRRTGAFTRYMANPDDRGAISNDAIPAIYGDPSGLLWLGTYAGLNRFNPRSGQVVHYTMKDGMSSNFVWGILPDRQGNLWLSTNNGLHRFDPQTKTFRVFGVAEGLTSGVFNAAHNMSSSGELMFGSVEGLVIFSPAEIKEETHRAPLVFTDFQLGNQPVPIGGDSVLAQPINKTGSLKLSYQDRVISFAFAALDFWAAEQIRYRYVLRGFSTQWTEVDHKRRFVTYTNLEPGDYLFLVQHTDRNDAWILPGRAISLTIVPPWWQTPGFRLALGALVIFSAAAAYRFRILMLHQRNQDLEQQVDVKTASLQLLDAELEQSITEIASLNQIAHTLNRGMIVEVMMEQVAVIITRLFRAMGVAVSLIDSDRQHIDVVDYHRVTDPTSSNSPTDTNAFQCAIAQLAIPQDFALDDLFPDGKPVIFEGTSPNPALSRFGPHSKRLGSAHLMLVPIYLRGGLIGALAVAREHAAHYFAPDDSMVGETIANQLANAIDSRRLFEEEHRLRETAEQRSHELAALLDISQEVSSMLELEPLLELIIHRLQQIIDFTSLIILGFADEELYVLAQHGVLSSSLAPEDELYSDWLQAETQLFTTRRPLILADLTQDRAMYEVLLKTFGPKSASFLQETRSCLMVPMVAVDRFVGLFWFGHDQPDYYTESQAEYAQAIAHQTATAIGNAQHHKEMQVAAADNERSRLAGELHDSVSQTLLSANMLARSVPVLWDQSPEKGRDSVRQLEQIIAGALAEMRSLMLELRPAILAQKPLGEILRQLGDGFAGRSQLPVQLNLKRDTILPAVCQVVFYRIAQGALDNIQQHAHASQVTMELDCTPQYTELRIADDGVGFDPAMIQADRMGLALMGERAEKIGATLDLQSKPGQGTQITIRYNYPIG